MLSKLRLRVGRGSQPWSRTPPGSGHCAVPCRLPRVLVGVGREASFSSLDKHDAGCVWFEILCTDGIRGLV